MTKMTKERFLTMLQRHSDALDSKQRFSSLLSDYCPQDTDMAGLLLLLYDMGIHTEIQKAERVTTDLAYQFANPLMEEHKADRQQAKTAVGLFCVCYGREALGKPCDLGKANRGGAGQSDDPMGNPPGAKQASHKKTGTGPAPPAPQAKQGAPSASRAIPVADIQKRYAENEIAGDMEFKGKRVKLAGTVEEISRESWHDSNDIRHDNDLFVGLQQRSPSVISRIRAYFPESEQMAVARLRKGQAIEFEGTIDGLHIGHWLRFKDCKLM
jgi:hypothetical protein